ncbi:MAG: tetratricopeptide repeat protein [Deltaproteobacteria bacterium]|nr:tetratricopeptide repeat protein [Deltaproteobacteria bacterium]MBW1929224.1 tetratricopeptide repeat protein [Deltaproteobacteria bacterium]MBW2025245.1 tetratricopeptide repeat protein [Deltaproteobacteria bacterium]
MDISACIITKNEEANIGQCIESILPVAGQVVVVDTGSTDTTAHIAKRMGTDVFQVPFSGDLAEARNYSLKKAVNDWVLVIDADERIGKEDYDVIKSLIETDDVDGYRIIVRNYTYDSSVEGWLPNDNKYPEYAHLPGFFPFNLVRLFRKSSRIRYEGFVHETNEKSLKGRKIIQSSVAIHHLGRIDKGITAKKDQLYLELGYRKIKADPKNPRAYYELAKQYMAFEQWEEALGLLRQAISYSMNDVDILFEYAIALQRLEKPSESIKIYQRVLEISPDHFGALVNMGVALRDLGRFDESEYFLNMALNLKPFHPLPLLHLGILMSKKGDHHKAISLLYSAFEKNPHDPTPLPELARCCVYSGRLDEAKSILKLMEAFNQRKTGIS